MNSETETASIGPTVIFTMFLHIYFSYQFITFMGLLTMKTRVIWFFCLLLGLISSFWITVFNTDMTVFASSDYSSLCHIWLLSLRNLYFSNERQKESGSGGKENWGGTFRSWRRRDYIKDILYVKRIYIQQKKKKTLKIVYNVRES